MASFRSLLEMCASVGMLLTPIGAAQAEILNIASTFPRAMPVVGDVIGNLPPRTARLTNGSIILRFHGPDDLVAEAETIEAVIDGRVDGAWAGANWFSEHDITFNLFSSVPFGPDAREYLAWLYKGGGLQLARAMFAEHGVYNIPCGVIPPEASGWFPYEINSVEDLRGLKMSFVGLGAEVMRRHGVETVQIAPGDISAALRNGEIDATEFSVPAMDRPLGFSRLLKYYYFPGWHQQATLFDLYINMDVWRSLSANEQTAIEVSCGDLMRDMLAEGEAVQWVALKALQVDGVNLRRWSPDILVSFEDAWLEIVAEEYAKNQRFAEVWDSYSTFRENYSIWRHFSYLR